MNPGYDADLKLARAAAQRAAEVIRPYFRTALEVTHKSPDQPLTAADLAANVVLREILIGARPEDGWLSEESVDTTERLSRQRVWVVDPIDGTRSFIAGLSEFAISIGLAVNGVAVVGVVHNPATREIYWAVRGGGAFAGREESDDAVPLHTHTISNNILFVSRSEIASGAAARYNSAWDVRALGSTAYKLARVAAGHGAFLSGGPKSEWDVCAGGLLVEEAGGRATDIRGNPLAYNNADPRLNGIIAADRASHAALMRNLEQ